MVLEEHKQSDITAPSEVTTDDSPAQEKDEVNANCEEQVKQLESKITELNEKVLRVYAEAENMKRRLTKEIEDAARYSISNFAHDMIEVLENLYRAIDSIPKEEIEHDKITKSIHHGIEMTRTFMLNNLEKHGIKRLYPVDQEFDHNFHQALSQVEVEDKAPGTIIQVVQAGYIVKDRLLRPALVIVSSAVSGQ